MKKSRWIRVLCLVLAALMVFSLYGCKKKAGTGAAAEAKKSAKNAVFKESASVSTDFKPYSMAAGKDKVMLFTASSGELRFVIADKTGKTDGTKIYKLSSEDASVSSSTVAMAEDGTIYLLDSRSDYENNEFHYELVHLNADGSLIDKKDVGSDMPYRIAALPGGGVAASSDSFIDIYDSSLNKTKSITKQNATQTWNNVLASGNDVLLFMTEEGKSTVNKVDINAGTIGAGMPYAATMGTVIGGQGYDFYIFNSGNKVSGVNLSQNTTTDVFNFLDSDIDTSMDFSVAMLDAENAFVLADAYTDNNICSFYTKVPPEQVTDKEVLTIGGFYFTSEQKKAIADFNKKNSKYRLHIVNYSEYNTPDTDFKGGYTVFREDVTSGNIPDIVFTNDLDNVQNYINKRLFTDLTPLMEKAGLNKSDYLENIIEAGTTKGKLYNIIPFFYLNGHIIKASHTNGKDAITIDEYMALEQKYNCSGTSMWYVTKEMVIKDALSYNTSDYLDVKTGKCNFDSEDFKKVLEFANEFCTTQDEMNTLYADVDYLNAYASNRMLMLDYGMGSFREIYRQEQSLFGEDTKYFGFPDLTGESKPVIKPNFSIAISSKCKDKEGAFEFIKLVLSPEYQKAIDNGVSGGSGFPILKSAFNEMAESAKEPYARKDESGNWVTIPAEEDTYTLYGKTQSFKNLPQDRLDYYKSLCTSATQVKYSEDKIINIINEEAAAYFSRQKSVDEVLRIINSRVNIYVRENE